MACIECLLLSVWAFAYTFFYTASTVNQAMFWHRVGWVGGSLFPPFAILFFILLSQRKQYISHVWQYAVIFLLPVILLIKNIFGKSTSLASGFVQSGAGWGWTYVNSVANVWTWIYLLTLGLYFSFGFYLLLQWRKESPYQTQKRQATVIIVVDLLVLIIGINSDFIIPFFNHFLPPLANISTLLFAAGFYYLISRQQLFSTMSSPDVILDTIMDPVLLLDEQGKIIRCNLATDELLKYDREALTGKTLSTFFQQQQYNQESLKMLAEQNRLENREIDLVSSDGEIIHTVLSAAVARDSIDGFMGIIISFHDITARMEIQQELLKSRENYKRLADELYQLANYDTLTHLPNRRLFHQQLAAYASHYGAIKDDFAVIFLDLNHFKKINDQYGHVVGDQVLIETAKRLESVRLQNEILSRMGGDEFTLIIPALQSETTLSQRINALKAAFSAPFLINNLSLKLSISAGAARYSQADQHLNILLKCADEQMYQDKRTKNCDHFSQKLE